MANSNGGKIQFGIGFNVDKSGLKDLEKSLKDLMQASPKDLFGTEAGTEEARKNMSKLKEQILKVQDALKQAYNPKLDTLNIDKFNKALDKSGTSLNQVYQSFSKANAMGTKTFNTLAREVLTTNVKLKQTHSILDSMGTTMINTIKWSAASTIMNTFTGSIQNAYNYVKALNGSLTDIRIVTGYSKDQMNQFADSANKAAQALGRQTKEYTNAALTFYQQGLSDEEVQVRTETTLKAANITGAEASAVADQLTAVWNGFQVSLEDTEDVVSKMAAVADSSASNMSELATAMSRVASVANNMGVDVDQLNAQIATIIATTRQAPQTVGNALKTIYARINDIKAGTDEAEMSLGNYTGKMAELGINVLDSNGRLRDTGDVMEQIGERWSTMTREQQIYLTQTMAGQRQMNNLMALFEHWDMYTKELNVSLQAQGTLDQKNAIAMESLAAHTRELQVASEGLIQTFVNGDSFIGFIDAGTKALQILTDFIDTIGGGGNALLTLGGIATQVFSKQIGKEINNLVTNFQNFVFNKQQMDQLRQNVNDVANINNIKDSEIVTGMINRQQEVQKYYSIMSSEQKNFYNQLVKTEAKVKQQRVDIENNADAASDFATKLLGASQKLKLLGENSLPGEQLNQLRNKIEEVQIAIKNASAAANDFDNNIDFDENGAAFAATETYEKLYESVQQYFTVIKNDSAAGEAFVNQLKEIEQKNGAVAVLTKVKTEISGTSQEVRNLNHILDQGQAEWEQVAAKERLATDQLDEFGQKLKQSFNIQGITQLVGALAQVVGSMEAVSSITATWTDNQQDLADKLGSTIKVLPIAIMGFASLGKALQSITLLSGPVGWAITAVITAVGIATAAVHGYNQQLEENRQRLIEKNKEDIKELKTKEEEIQSNKKLISNYQDVYDKYKQGKASKEQLEEATKSLNGIVDQELIRVANLTGQYEGLNAAIKKVNTSTVNEQIQNTKDILSKTVDNLEANIQSLKNAYSSDGTETTLLGAVDKQGQFQSQYVNNKGQNFSKDAWQIRFAPQPNENALLKNLQNRSSLGQYIGSLNGTGQEYALALEDTSAAGFIQFYKDLTDTIRTFREVEDYQGTYTLEALEKIQEQIKEDVLALQDGQASIADAYLTQITLGYAEQLKNANNLEEYKEVREKIRNDLKDIFAQENIFIKQKELDSYVQSYIDTYAGELVQSFEDLRNLEEKAFDTLGQNRRSIFEAYFSTLSDQDKQIILANYPTFDEMTQTSEMDKLIWETKQKAEQASQQISSSLSTVLSESLLSSNGEFTEKESKQLEELIDNEIGLSQAAKDSLKAILNQNLSLKDRIDILQNIRKEQSQLDENAYQNYIDNYITSQTLKIQSEIDNLQAKMEAFGEEISKQLGWDVYLSQLQEALNKVGTELDPFFADIVLKAKEVQIEADERQIKTAAQNSLQNLAIGQMLADALGDQLIVSAEQMKTIVDLGFNQLLEGASIAYDEEGTFLGFQLDAKLVQQSKILETLRAEADKAIQALQTEKIKTQQQIVNTEKELDNLEKQLKDLQNQNPTNPEDIVRVEYQKSIKTQQKEEAEQEQERLIKYKAQLEIDQAQVTQESEELKQAWQQALEGKSEEAAEEFLLPYQEQLDNLKESLLKGSELTDEQKKLLQEVIALVPSLQKQVDVLLNDALKGTKEYEQALVDVEEAFEKIKISKAFENEQAIGENVLNFDITGPLDEFEEELKKLVEADYQTTISINADINSDFDRAVDQIEQINSAASKIGEDFVVAAEDIRQLNNVFPGILQGMESLGDGSIKLSEQVVRATTEGSRQEAEAALRSAIERMQAEKIVLEAKRDAAQKLLDQAIAISKDETLTEEEKQNAILDLQKKAANLIEDTSNDVALSQATIADNTITALDAANAEGANNFASAMNSAIDNSADTGQIINQNLANAIKNGLKGEESLSVNRNHVSSTYKSGGSSGAAVHAFNKSNMVTDSGTGTVTTDKVNNESLISSLSNYLDYVNDEINDKEGRIAEAQARIDKLQNSLNKLGQGSGSGKSGGGGGGGGKDKSKSADQIQDMKLKNEQIDLYHELDRAIKATQETIDDYDKAAKKTVRNGLAQTIDNQIEALEKQKGLYEQKIGMMQAQLQAQQANLAALGVQFDEQGNIINYTGLMIEYQNLYNSLLEEAKFLTGDAQEGKLRQAEAVKAKLEALRSQMGAYEALQDKITEAGNAIQDILDKEEELRIEQFKINIDVQLDFAEAERDWNEFRKKVIDQIKDDDYVGQATARLADFDSYYKPDGGGIIQELTEHVNRTREEAEIIQNGGTSQIYGRNEAQALEDLKHYTDELMQNLEDVEQIAKDIQDLYLDTIKKAKDAFDDQIGQYEQITKLLEHDINLIQLVHPRENEEELARYYGLIHQNNLQQIDMYRKQVDMWKERMDAAEEGTQAWKEFRDNWEDSLNSMNDAVEAAVENLITRYETAIGKIVRETKDSMVGGDWQAALDEWDKNQWLSDFALDPLERATALADVLGDIDKDINNSKNLQYQRDLLKLRDAILDDAEKQEYLTETEVKMYQMQLELMQRQQALRQAEQSKTTMRLRRDSQGNYTYQFVADEDNIADKRQQLRDLWEEYRQLLSNDLPEIQNSIIERTEQYWDKYKELSLEFYDNQELLKEKLAELEEQYYGEEGYITILANEYYERQGQAIIATGGQLSAFYQEQGEALRQFLGIDDSEEGDSVWGAIKTLINADDGLLPTALTVFTTETIPQNFKKINKDTQDLLFTSLQPSWDTLFEHMTQKIVGVDGQFENTSNNIKSYLQNIIVPATNQALAAAEEYQTGLNNLANAAGIDLSYIGSGINYNIAATQALIHDNGELINSYNAEISAIQNVVNQIASLVNEYDQARMAAIAAADAAMKFWMAALGYGVDLSSPDLGGGTAAASSPGTSGSSSGSGSGNGGSPGGSGGSRSSSSGLETRTYVGSNGDIYYTTGSGSNPEADRLKKANTTLTRQGMAMFDTGGYTGNWVNDVGSGKLAILHDKELVLNQNDTANILSAVEYMRGIVDKVGNLNSNLSGLSSNFLTGTTTNNNDNSTSQNIVINADFPGVSDALEIKNAFNNLMNIASQYANGNRRTY